MKLILAVVFGCLWMTLVLGPAWAGELRAPEFVAAVGAHDTAAKVGPFAEAGLEVRLAPRRFALVPAVGAGITEEGSAWVYGSLLRPFEWGSVEVLPTFGVALFSKGDEQDLGGPVEFRSGLEVRKRTERTTIGLLFYHLSNAGLYDSNPGTNSLLLTVAF